MSNVAPQHDRHDGSQDQYFVEGELSARDKWRSYRQLLSRFYPATAQIRVSNKFISSANITKDFDRSMFRLAVDHLSGSGARSEEITMQWKEITAERYMEALESARPMLWLPYGFLRGRKPIVYRDCRIVKQIQPIGTPFVTSKGKHWQGSECLTVTEFAMLDLDTVGPSN